MSIHALAVVDPAAEIGTNVTIGPFCVIEADVRVGEGCTLASGVTIRRGTTLGPHNEVCEGTLLGGLAQHSQRPEKPGRVEIGEGNVIRENVTVHCALHGDNATRIGSRSMLMVGAHVGHDCVVGDEVILTNNVLLGGHVTVGNRAYLGGGVAVHQFCRIGRLVMVGGMARVTQDLPPFMMIDGDTVMVVGLNKVGLRRAGLEREEVAQLKAAYQVIYRSGLSWEEMLNRLAGEFTSGPAAELEPFFRGSKRGIVQERRRPPGATIRLVVDEEKAPAAEEQAPAAAEQAPAAREIEKLAG